MEDVSVLVWRRRVVELSDPHRDLLEALRTRRLVNALASSRVGAAVVPALVESIQETSPFELEGGDSRAGEL